MKRLLVALVAAVAVSTVFARITDTQLFEESFADFKADVQDQDSSELAEYAVAPSVDVPYPCASFGSKYLSLDTGDATLWRTNTVDGDVYFDMVVQFNPCTEAPEVDADTKLAVYLDAASNLVVSAGLYSGATKTNLVTNTQIEPGSWHRLSVSSIKEDYESPTTGYKRLFKIYVDGNAVSADVDLVSVGPKTITEFESRVGGLDEKPVSSVGFKGSGALDNFVARTTDPFYVGEYAASIGTGNGSEKFATCAEALTEALKYGGSITRNLLGASAQDGSAAAPFQISDVDTLKAFQAAAAEGYGLDKCYVQTADIDMTSAGAFAGIGTYAKVPTSGKPFVGTYDGQGYTISNVQRAGGDTQGIFNQVGVGGVVENLVVSNMYWDTELSGEYGFAIVGNAGGGATLRNLTAEGTFASAAKPSTHNIAGIVVRVCGGATADVATTIDSCTNNATIYGGYTKLGGICAIAQQQTGFTAGKVVFSNCANNGTLVCKRTATDVTGNAGIVGYVAANNVELTGCYGDGDIINSDGANTSCDGALVGQQYKDYTLKDNGGNSAPANKKMIGYYGDQAKVTGFQYATVDNDVATTVTSLAAGNTYLLEGNVAASETPVFTFAEAGTIAFNTNGYNFAGTVAGSSTVEVSEATEGSVITFTAVVGLAAVQGDDNVWKWFASSADAFTYARAQSLQPNMKFKVGSDFTPDISSNLTLWTLEFVATTEDPITINLTNGNAKLVSTRIKFPTTATLNAVSGNVNSMSGGTLNVPSGVVLELASYATDGSSWNIAGLSGSGTIKNDDKSMYFFLGNTQYNLPTRMRGSSWCGTLELSGSNISGSNTWEAEFNKFANANSKVRFNGLTTPLYASGNDSVAIELVGNGLTISGEYESARTYTVGGTITGSGALTLADNTGILLLSGDTSGFTGSVTASGTSAVIFNSTASSTGSGNRIYVGTGKSATIGSSATWTAANLVLLGELTVNGTLAVNNNCIWCDKGVGVLRYANKDTLPTSAKFAGSWNSKCIIACDPGNKRFVLNNFGNANSTLEIAGDNGVFSALPSTDNTAGTAPSINPAVILTANWTVSDGWAEADKITTFSKLSGSGNLTVNGSTSGTAAIYYTITELNDYTGTLGGNRGNFTISKVNVATQPAVGTRVVKTNIGANGAINNNVPLYVGGVDTGKTLTYDANGADGAGLYVKASAPVTPIDTTTGGTAEYVDDSAATAAAAAINADKANLISVAEGVTGEAKNTYLNKVEAVANGNTVTIQFTSDAATEAQTQADADNASLPLANIAAAEVSADATIAATPGFYYTVESGTEPGDLKAGTSVLATGTTVTLPIPNMGEAGFYKIKITPTK